MPRRPYASWYCVATHAIILLTLDRYRSTIAVTCPHMSSIFTVVLQQLTLRHRLLLVVRVSPEVTAVAYVRKSG